MPKITPAQSALIGIWISIGEVAEEYCSNNRVAHWRRPAGSENEPDTPIHIPALTQLRGMLDQTVDGMPVRRIMGVESMEEVPDQWLLAVSMVFYHHHIFSGLNPGLPPQVLSSRIAHVLSDRPKELVWITQDIVRRMVKEGVLIENSEGVDLGRVLRHFVSGEQEEKPVDTKSEVQKDLESFLSSVPKLSPAEMVDGIRSAGYVSQDEAVHSLCLAVFRHFRRILRCNVGGADSSKLPPVGHVLISGPTGSGKSHVLNLLFRNVLGFQNVSYFDCSSCTQVGVVGDSIQSSLLQLLRQNHWNSRIAQNGIIVLDEFDKLSLRVSNDSESGRAVSRATTTGVQQSLLKMMEPGRINLAPYLEGRNNSRPIMMETGNVMFICLGAFPHRKRKRTPGNIGFSASSSHPKPFIQGGEIDFVEMGLMRELLGRFSEVVSLNPLTRSAMRKIMSEQVTAQYRKELQLEGIGLEIEDAVYDSLVDQSIRLGVGARALHRSLGNRIKGAMFEAYSQRGNAKDIILRENDGEIVHEVYSL